MKKLFLAAALSLAFAPAAFAGSNQVPAPYGGPYYAATAHAPTQNTQPVYASAGYEDEVVVYEERARRKQSHYFKPRDARSLKCRTKQGTQKCTFAFHGENADDVEFYLAQALIYATGNMQNQAQCHHKRRGESVTCAVRGDLSGMDTRKLRYALYGR